MNAIRCYDVAGPVFEFVTRLSIRRGFDNKHLLLLHHVALEDVNRTLSFFCNRPWLTRTYFPCANCSFEVLDTARRKNSLPVEHPGVSIRAR